AQHEGDLRHGLLPHGPLLCRVDAEALELHARGRLAGAELHPAARDEVEHRDALGDARRVVVAGRHEHDAVAQADALRALAAGGEEDLGRRRVRVLLEEVVLDLPGVVEPEAIGELDLVERLADETRLAVLVPGSRELVLVEDAELHARVASSADRSVAPQRGSRCGVRTVDPALPPAPPSAKRPAMPRGPGPVWAVHRLLIATAMAGALVYALWELREYVHGGGRGSLFSAVGAVVGVIGLGLFLPGLRRLGPRLPPAAGPAGPPRGGA